MSIRNALIDRDGTIIVEKHYLHDPTQVELVPGAGEALGRLAKAGVRMFVVTNQSGIGRGYYSELDFWSVQKRLDELVAPYGIRFDGVLFCPHAPDERCACRKPATGMWDDLHARLGLQASETVMIGDNASDVAFGLARNMAQSVLVLTGHGRRYAEKLGLPVIAGGFETIRHPDPGQPTLLAHDLAAAVDFILKDREEAS